MAILEWLNKPHWRMFIGVACLLATLVIFRQTLLVHADYLDDEAKAHRFDQLEANVEANVDKCVNANASAIIDTKKCEFRCVDFLNNWSTTIESGICAELDRENGHP